jgi:glucose-6-phosphate isomerase
MGDRHGERSNNRRKQAVTAEDVLPFGVQIDLAKGIMENPDNHIVRRASSMKGHYADETALQRIIEQGDPVHYEVFEKMVPQIRGHLQICISSTNPGIVGEEFFMTKGHYHEDVGTAETYLCLCGYGYMLMKTSDGESAVEDFKPGRLVYVPPFWAHRTVNTGAEPLISFCVYPAEAGHNYGDIELEGFPKRVVRRNGQVKIVSA